MIVIIAIYHRVITRRYTNMYNQNGHQSIILKAGSIPVFSCQNIQSVTTLPLVATMTTTLVQMVYQVVTRGGIG